MPSAPLGSPRLGQIGQQREWLRSRAGLSTDKCNGLPRRTPGLLVECGSRWHRRASWFARNAGAAVKPTVGAAARRIGGPAAGLWWACPWCSCGRACGRLPLGGGRRRRRVLGRRLRRTAKAHGRKRQRHHGERDGHNPQHTRREPRRVLRREPSASTRCRPNRGCRTHRTHGDESLPGAGRGARSHSRARSAALLCAASWDTRLARQRLVPRWFDAVLGSFRLGGSRGRSYRR